MKVINLIQNTVLAENCRAAKSFYTRFKGLMGKNELEEGCGLLITPCKSIHMFFMKFPLDVVFLDETDTVVHIIENIKPWKFTGIIRKAHSVLELPAGTVKNTGTQVGDRLQLIFFHLEFSSISASVFLWVKQRVKLWL